MVKKIVGFHRFLSPKSLIFSFFHFSSFLFLLQPKHLCNLIFISFSVFFLFYITKVMENKNSLAAAANQARWCKFQLLKWSKLFQQSLFLFFLFALVAENICCSGGINNVRFPHWSRTRLSLWTEVLFWP